MEIGEIGAINGLGGGRRNVHAGVAGEVSGAQ